MAKIILATFGSLGDLHPFIALGKALQAKNHAVILAAPSVYMDKVRAVGLDAVSIFPDFKEVGLRLKCSDEDVIRCMMESSHFCIEEFVLPSLAASCEALMTTARGAAAIVGHFLVPAAPLVAEKLNIPFIPAHLHPLSLFTMEDPPTGPEFPLLLPSPRRAFSRLWNRTWIGFMRYYLKRRYAPLINRIRTNWGLAPLTKAPIFHLEKQPPLVLCLYSRVFARPQHEFPPNMYFVGFPRFDSSNGTDETADENLLRFMDSGPPPLVFTLGSLADMVPGAFFDESLETARLMGRRAVLLTGCEKIAARTGGSVFVCKYAPYSAIFPKAVGVVHHGGVGTIGTALRAGVPQLAVPHMGDQWDNSARVQRMGVGRTIPASGYSAARARLLLDHLLADATVAERVAQMRRIVAGEDAAEVGATIVDKYVSTR